MIFILRMDLIGGIDKMSEINNVISSNLKMESVPKDLVAYGVSVTKYLDAKDARGHTYTTRDDGYPPTPFISPLNPFNTDILESKNVLEIGPGVGRNLPFVMEQTNAHYYGVDPNVEMTKYFWDIQDPKWKDRVTLCQNFKELPPEIEFDFVIVVFVFQHIGYRVPFGQMDIGDITLEAMQHTKVGTIWFVLEHEREEKWQQRWLTQCNIMPEVYYKPGGDHAGGGAIPYPEFELMTHRGNDNNIIIFKEDKQ